MHRTTTITDDGIRPIELPKFCTESVKQRDRARKILFGFRATAGAVITTMTVAGIASAVGASIGAAFAIGGGVVVGLATLGIAMASAYLNVVRRIT